MRLVLTLFPHWANDEAHIDLVRFTDGITNTLLKAVNRRPGLTKAQIDKDAVLLRAYGNGTDVLIDREREAANHELLMRHNLAPQLLARFGNGMLYRFIPGAVAQPKDLSDPPILKAIARRLAQWHATVPCIPDSSLRRNSESNGVNNSDKLIVNAAAGKPIPNVWTTMQKWILALPTDTEQRRERKALLQEELEEMIRRLAQRPGLGNNGVCWLLQLLEPFLILHIASLQIMTLLTHT
jgi:ethanolamine kinase